MYKMLLKKKLLHKGKNTLKLKTDDPVARMSGITLINGKTFKSSSGPYYRDHSETLLIRSLTDHKNLTLLTLGCIKKVL